jgi:hypothetical protein
MSKLILLNYVLALGLVSGCSQFGASKDEEWGFVKQQAVYESCIDNEMLPRTQGGKAADYWTAQNYCSFLKPSSKGISPEAKRNFFDACVIYHQTKGWSANSANSQCLEHLN